MEEETFTDRTLTTENRARMFELCQRIAGEKAPEVFDQLVRELNRLLNGNGDQCQSAKTLREN